MQRQEKAYATSSELSVASKDANCVDNAEIYIAV